MTDFAHIEHEARKLQSAPRAMNTSLVGRNPFEGERFNAPTHLVGAVLALAGSAVLIALTAFEGDAWKLAGVIMGLQTPRFHDTGARLTLRVEPHFRQSTNP
jgi:hypothetical protein